MQVLRDYQNVFKSMSGSYIVIRGDLLSSASLIESILKLPVESVLNANYVFFEAAYSVC